MNLQQFIQSTLLNDENQIKMELISNISSFKKKYHSEYESIIDETSFLPQDAKLQERLYCIMNDLNKRPKCLVCNNDTKFNSFKEGYRRTCSNKCSNDSEFKRQCMLDAFENDPTKVDNIRKANKKEAKRKKQDGTYERIGEGTRQRFASMTEDEKIEFGNKISLAYESKTDEAKLEHSLNLSKAHTKAKEENPEEYKARYEKIVETKNVIGDDGLNVHQRASIKIQDTKNNTIMEDGRTLMEHCVEASTKTKLERYGYSFYNLDKARITWKEKYGVDNPFQLESTKEASLQAKEKRMDIQLSNYYDRCVTEYASEYPNLTIITSKDEFLDSKSRIVSFRCTCGNTFQSNIKDDGFYAKCRICNMSYGNKTQQSIFDMLKEYDDTLSYSRFDLIRSEKDTAIELDIYSDEHKIAIEYDGLMWHSFGKSKHSKFNTYMDESLRKYSHKHKTDECDKIGIKLFHIFENEYTSSKKQIWDSVLKNALGISTRIYARKCQIKTVNYLDSKEFLMVNHLQGDVISSIRYGLFYEDELISLMTFGKSRYDSTSEYELLRFCNKLNITVVGGASKLLKHFIASNSPKSIVSYANRRWSNGNLYERLGFTKIHTSMPNYFFFNENSGKLYSRLSFQKHKLPDMLENYDPSKPDDENIYDNGYRKIYDSGNIVYKWRKE